jgi:hypothetical protein
MVVQKSPVSGFLGARRGSASISTSCSAAATGLVFSVRPRSPAPAAARTAQAASASPPRPDTLSTAGRAPAFRPRPEDGGRWCSDRSPRPAAGAEDVEPRRSGDQRCPDGGRPQHVAASGRSPIPALDDELGFGTRSPVRSKLRRTGLDVRLLTAANRRGADFTPKRSGGSCEISRNLFAGTLFKPDD